ncbi:MAG: hypothetical protein [Cryophage ML09]|nr:MAG: hypothetical protein [Cryophage ML09]
MKEIKLTLQDYKNALEIWFNYRFKTDNELSFPGYLEKIIAELEKPEPEPEKITWQEVVTLIKNYKSKTSLPQRFYIELIKILERIKTDHLS